MNTCLQCGNEHKGGTRLCHSCRVKTKVGSSRECPKCGGKKHIGAQLCWECHLESYGSSKTRRSKIPCPKCGKPMLKESTTCISCAWGADRAFLEGNKRRKSRAAKPNWNLVTDEFLHQFVGLFLGEGSVGLHKDKNCDTALSIRLSIGLRYDDLETLKLVQKMFGGSIYMDKNGRANPVARWQVHSISDIDHILHLIRPLIVLPMRKVNEIDLALEFLDYRVSRNMRELSSEKVTDFFDRMQALRKFAMPDL